VYYVVFVVSYVQSDWYGTWYGALYWCYEWCSPMRIVTLYPLYRDIDVFCILPRMEDQTVSMQRIPRRRLAVAGSLLASASRRRHRCDTSDTSIHQNLQLHYRHSTCRNHSLPSFLPQPSHPEMDSHLLKHHSV
jgi:hypothetical protein